MTADPTTTSAPEARRGASRTTRPDVGRLLRPRAIAIVGASAREGSFGQRLLASVTSGRFRGEVYPVNPRYEELAGLPCYPDLASTPTRADCAAFAVSDDLVEEALLAAADAGVPTAALFGRAYDAPPPGTPSRVERLAAIAREARMAVLGPNCMGFVNLVDGLKVSGNPPPIADEPGAIGLVSHSGSTWSGLVGNGRDLAFNYAVSAGQEIATTMADYIRFVLDQPETRVVGCVMEAVRDPENFLEVLDLADARGLPVVVLKLGRSDYGRELALAHSGALAGSASAYEAVFARRNVVSVRTPDELTDTLELFACPRRPHVPGLGIVTDSGGERELIADLAHDLGAPLADIGPETREALAQVLDPGMLPANPVDSYGDGRMLLGECLAVLAGDAEVGTVALATNLVDGRPYAHRSAVALEEVHRNTDKPTVLFGNLHSAVSRTEAARLRRLGIPVLMGTTTSLLAMKHVGAWQARRGTGVPAARPGEHRPRDWDRLEAAIRACHLPALPGALADEILASFGIATTPSRYVADENGAVRAAAELRFPVVLKTADPAILHKTERGGVVVGLRDEEAVREAYRRIAAACGPQMQVQAQAVPGVELLLGMTTDPTFGPMMTVALGGTMTELLQDAVTVEPAIGAEEALTALKRLRGFRLLEGYRGAPPADLDALAATVSRFSQLCRVAGHLFEAVDLNPILAGPTGAVAVDALFLRRRECEGAKA